MGTVVVGRQLMSSCPLGWTGANERTFIAVKPDGVQRKLVGEIVCRFEKKGFKLLALKLMQVLDLFQPDLSAK